jgi:uncharacterized membrane-anchored protein
MLIAANGLDGGDLTRAVQRLQELGNYRNLAARPAGRARGLASTKPRPTCAAGRSAQPRRCARRRPDGATFRARLEIAAVASATDYRMSATAAYALLVEERLHELAPTDPGFISLSEFTQRRFLPVRTCAAFSARERQVAARAVHLAAAHPDRNTHRKPERALLASLERSATHQLRLQHLVEGLSVVGISYYDGADRQPCPRRRGKPRPLRRRLAIGVITPIVIAATWLGLAAHASGCSKAGMSVIVFL